jgi:hypothetical protein
MPHRGNLFVETKYKNNIAPSGLPIVGLGSPYGAKRIFIGVLQIFSPYGATKQQVFSEYVGSPETKIKYNEQPHSQSSAL